LLFYRGPSTCRIPSPMTGEWKDKGGRTLFVVDAATKAVQGCERTLDLERNADQIGGILMGPLGRPFKVLLTPR
jgi:hypothetical protein